MRIKISSDAPDASRLAVRLAEKYRSVKFNPKDGSGEAELGSIKLRFKQRFNEPGLYIKAELVQTRVDSDEQAIQFLIALDKAMGLTD